MAGGLGVACCCDVTIGTADAKFAFSETRIGISPAQIARYVMQKCGESTGRRLMLSAARFAGEQAAALGIVDVVVPDADGLEAAEARIRADVLACAPGAVAATKTLIRTLPTLPDEQKMRFAAENFTDCLKGDEGVEGVASFLEKRKPNWHQEGEA
jgi:isohexenylglutaconyl-CoA hydratase